jgi:hypothetical protein
MEAANKPSLSNDYAVARELNSLAGQMILCVVMAETVGLPEDHNISDLNRVYVLLIDELQRLYGNNPTLAAIKPEPIWVRNGGSRTRLPCVYINKCFSRAEYSFHQTKKFIYQKLARFTDTEPTKKRPKTLI